MLRNLGLALLVATAAAPLSAADISTTHEMVTMPPGKLHAIAFRPVKSQPCATPSINPTGSRIHAAPQAAAANCDADRDDRELAQK